MTRFASHAFVTLFSASLLVSETSALADSMTSGDFNGDGFADMVVGVPSEDIGALDKAGSINIIYGSMNKLTSLGNLSLHQDSSGITGVAEAKDYFGSSVSAGDFNGDGFDDLAVAALGETVGASGRGAIHILWGSASGVTASGDVFITQETLMIPEAASYFGSSMLAVDFDVDGFCDLAIGEREAEVSGTARAGAVHVVYGSAAGLNVARVQLWTLDSELVPSYPTENDRFGASLAAGDFDSDGFPDLAIGAPYDRWNSGYTTGSVIVLSGTDSGLTSNNSQIWMQDIYDLDIREANANGDLFGYALAAGDLNGDGFDDLAIGAPGDTVRGFAHSGVVNVLLGSEDGLSVAGNLLLHQDKNNVADTAEVDDYFGHSLACADFNADGYADLAVCSSGEVFDASNSGSVHVFPGSVNGPDKTKSQLIAPTDANLLKASNRCALFGTSMAVGDFNGNGRMDLAIAAPYEYVNSIDRAGVIHTLYGARSGLSLKNNQIWHQDSPGIADGSEAGDGLGYPSSKIAY